MNTVKQSNMISSFSKYFLLTLMVTQLMGQSNTPTRFALKTVIQDTFLTEGLSSNIVAEIRTLGDSLTWLGTGQGLALHDGHRIFAYQTSADSLKDGQFTKLVPQGGIPAIAVMGDTMAVAYSGDNGNIQVGYGVTLTYDAQDTSGITWTYLKQPVDNVADTLKPFGEGYYRQLPVTVPEANVTYDADLSGDFLWTASWAGGLRRYHLTKRAWENVPMPMDGQDSLSLCEGFDETTSDGKSVLPGYYLNPRDPGDGGNHNHKAFSVIAYGDTVWVGTANGVNKGIMIVEVNEVSPGIFEILNCIEWEHYSYPDDGLAGNFVVGLAKQLWNGQITIWAASLYADKPGESRGLSYTRDDGVTWNTTLLNERVYNVTTKDSLVFASTSSGLWKSHDGENWAKYSAAIDTAFLAHQQILTDLVYTSSLDERDTIPKLWIGTSDGVALSSDIHGASWSIFQTEYDTTEVYAYPNPFSPLSHNQLNGDGYVRFHTGEVYNTEIILDIFNFAMEKVYSENFNLNKFRGAVKWNGRGQTGALVSNGVYFARINFAYSANNSPKDFWTKIIVVK
ncbi:MAG: hypothetical protein HN716_00750 [Candidatus Marinimicrobia bacterium]|jgi:hypothetical protein|nr:hypothetical protein [Candidatus Neomarinimicrobiota bacterium]MBT7944634.1 hypothetical protein [Candidatus Neomarinimicrobiota bacterium]